MQRELKRQIKQDDLVTGVEKLVAWWKANEEQAQRWTLLALAVIVAGGGYQWYRLDRDRSAQKALGEALAVLDAPVRAEQPGAPAPVGTSFATAQERLTKAATALDGVSQSYSALAVGRQAAYQAAVCRLQLGQLDQARKELSELAARREDALLAGEARLSLADLELQAGNTDKAVETLRQLAEDEKGGVPRDYALMRLGTALEFAQRNAEAAKAYRRLSQDFPESVFAREAQTKAEYLEPGVRS